MRTAESDMFVNVLFMWVIDQNMDGSKGVLAADLY